MKYEAMDSKQIADPHLKHGYCMNGSFSTLKTIRESNPQHLLHEAVIKTYPYAKLLQRLNKTCDTAVPLRFRNLTFGQIGYEDDPEYSSLKVTDWVETSGDEDKEGVIPYFAFRVAVQDDETMKSEVLKQLTCNARWCGYEVTDARTMSIKKQPFEDCKTCILDVQIEARYTQTPVKLAPTMYHISPARYYEKIRARGLVPYANSKEFIYESRVYLFNQVSLDEREAYGTKKTISLKELPPHDMRFCMFKINGTKLSQSEEFKSGKLKFFCDLTFGTINDDDAVFTYEPISLKYFYDDVMVYEIGSDDMLITRLDKHGHQIPDVKIISLKDTKTLLK